MLKTQTITTGSCTCDICNISIPVVVHENTGGNMECYRGYLRSPEGDRQFDLCLSCWATAARALGIHP